MRRGFTLIEILIVLGILGISFFAAYHSLTRFSAGLSLNAAAKAVVTDLRSLQAKAVSQHKTLELSPASIKLPDGIKIISGTPIKFSPSGFSPPGGSGTWVLENRLGKQKKIITTSMGRVRVE